MTVLCVPVVMLIFPICADLLGIPSFVFGDIPGGTIGHMGASLTILDLIHDGCP
jgi:hypothetical protein